MADDEKHGFVYTPVDSPTAKVELFDTAEEADAVMTQLNAAFAARHPSGAGAVQINDDIVTTAPVRIHVTKFDLAARRKEAEDAAAAAQEPEPEPEPEKPKE
jgi:hypothetical protein